MVGWQDQSLAPAGGLVSLDCADAYVGLVMVSTPASRAARVAMAMRRI